MHRFHLLPELNLAVSEFGEEVDDRSLMEHLRDVYDHPEFRPGMDELSSFLNTRDALVTAEGLRQIARTFPRRKDKGARPNLVAVVTTTTLGIGLGRLYSAHADSRGVTVDVFDRVATAGDWLDTMRGRREGTTAGVLERLLSAQ